MSFLYSVLCLGHIDFHGGGEVFLCVYNHLTLFVASDSEMTELSSVCGCFSGVSEADTHSQSHVK